MIGSAPTTSSTTAMTMNGTSRYGHPDPLNKNFRRLKGSAVALIRSAA